MRISRYSISFICRLTDGLWILVENGERSGQKRSRSAMKLQRRSVKRRSRRLKLPSTPSTRSTLAKRSGISARTSACHKPLVFSCRLLTTRLRSSCTFFFSFGSCREHEEEFLAQMSESLSTGTTWQRICDIIDLQNSQSKTIARTGAGTTDLTRFREVLLRLKREGESAPGAAGY